MTINIDNYHVYPWDVDWFTIADGKYIHAMSFGGGIPWNVDVLGDNVRHLYEAYQLREMPEMECEVIYNNEYIDERLQLQYERVGSDANQRTAIRERYLRHFTEMAKRGFYSFDRDVNENSVYHLIARPSRPLEEWNTEDVPALPSEWLSNIL